MKIRVALTASCALPDLRQVRQAVVLLVIVLVLVLDVARLLPAGGLIR